MTEKMCNNQSDFRLIKEAIVNSKHLVITTHINPDGDCITSVLVFSAILRRLEKSHSIILDDTIPHKFDFLPDIHNFDIFDRESQLESMDTLVILDSSTLERIGRISECIPKNITIVNIDHHSSNIRYGNVNYIDDSESSTVEIIYSLHQSYPFEVTQEIATLVYTGIICDTGRFLFPNTTNRSLHVASEMIKKGASPSEIANSIYYRNKPETIQGLVSALSTIKYYFNGRVAGMELSNGAGSPIQSIDTEGFVDYLLTIEGTEVEFFIYEKESNVFRISFRSKNNIDVNAIAQELGGGGHKRASGCTVQGRLEDVRKRVLEILSQHMK
jgi:phosphoesterase RecJ-like protein